MVLFYILYREFLIKCMCSLDGVVLFFLLSFVDLTCELYFAHLK